VSVLAATWGRAGRGIDRYGVRGFATRATLRGLRPVLAPVAARRLRVAGERAPDLDALVDIPFSLAPFGVELPCGQVRAEILGLLEAVAAERPRRLLEIGTAGGGTLFMLALAADRAATIVSVDLPQGEFGGGYPVWKIPLYRGFVRRTQRLHLIRGDSHAPETLARTRAALRGEALDFLLIDGDHTYDGVRRDYQMYSQLVAPGGIVAFHDICNHPGMPHVAVDLLWRQLRFPDPKAKQEIVTDPPTWGGIGWFHMASQVWIDALDEVTA
jgi:predicted O-methyltransferase YrrM